MTPGQRNLGKFGVGLNVFGMVGNAWVHSVGWMLLSAVIIVFALWWLREFE